MTTIELVSSSNEQLPVNTEPSLNVTPPPSSHSCVHIDSHQVIQIVVVVVVVVAVDHVDYV